MHVSFHRFPSKSEPAKHKRWLLALDLSKSDIADHRPSPAPTVTPASSEPTDGEDSAPGTRMSTSVNEVLLSDCGVCELPSDELALDISGISGSCTYESSTNVIANAALVARVEALEAGKKQLRQLSSHSKPF